MIIVFILSIWTLELLTILSLIFEPAFDKTDKMACAPSEDSDQPGHSAQSDQSSLCTQWIMKNNSRADSKDSDQTEWMSKLI